jgi:hypothetical protein
MTRSSMRGWGAAAVTTVALVLGLAALPGAAATSALGARAGVDLDIRPLGKAAAIEQCATKRFVDDRRRLLRVRYGMKQRTPSGSRGSFVLRNHAGRFMFCDMFGRDRPSTLPMPRPNKRRVAVHATNPDRRPICTDGVRTGMRYGVFFRVRDPVRSARTRYWVDGVAQPWFTSKRQGRFVHLQSWQSGLAGDAGLSIQTQLRNRDGKVLSVKGIPSKPQRVPRSCVQIG